MSLLIYWMIFQQVKSDESIFKSKEAKEKPCGMDEASMEKDEGAEARRWEEKWCDNGIWRSSQVRLGQHSRKGARGNQEGEL